MRRDTAARQKTPGSVSKYAAAPEAQTTKLIFNVRDCSVDIDRADIDVGKTASADENDDLTDMSMSTYGATDTSANSQRNAGARSTSMSFFQRAAKWWKDQSQRRNRKYKNRSGADHLQIPRFGLSGLPLVLDESQPSLLIPLADSLLLAAGRTIPAFGGGGLGGFKSWRGAARRTVSGGISVNRSADLTLDDLVVIKTSAEHVMAPMTTTTTTNGSQSRQNQRAFVDWCRDAAILERMVNLACVYRNTRRAVQDALGAMLACSSELCSDFVIRLLQCCSGQLRHAVDATHLLQIVSLAAHFLRRPNNAIPALRAAMVAQGCVEILLELTTAALVSAGKSLLDEVGMRNHEVWFGPVMLYDEEVGAGDGTTTTTTMTTTTTTGGNNARHPLLRVDPHHSNSDSRANLRGAGEKVSQHSFSPMQQRFKPLMVNNKRTGLASSVDSVGEGMSATMPIRLGAATTTSSFDAEHLKVSSRSALPVAVPKLALPILPGVHASHERGQPTSTRLDGDNSLVSSSTMSGFFTGHSSTRSGRRERLMVSLNNKQHGTGNGPAGLAGVSRSARTSVRSVRTQRSLLHGAITPQSHRQRVSMALSGRGSPFVGGETGSPMPAASPIMRATSSSMSARLASSRSDSLILPPRDGIGGGFASGRLGGDFSTTSRRPPLSALRLPLGGLPRILTSSVSRLDSIRSLQSVRLSTVRALTHRMGMVPSSAIGVSAGGMLSSVDKPAFMMEMVGKGFLDARSQLADLAGHLGESYVADHVWSLVALQREEEMQRQATRGIGPGEGEKQEEEEEVVMVEEDEEDVEEQDEMCDEGKAKKLARSSSNLSDAGLERKNTLNSLLQDEQSMDGANSPSSAVEFEIGVLSVECAARILMPQKKVFLSPRLLSRQIDCPVSSIFNLLVADAVAGFRLGPNGLRRFDAGCFARSPILGQHARKSLYDLLQGYENQTVQRSLLGAAGSGAGANSDGERDKTTRSPHAKQAGQNKFIFYASRRLLKLLSILHTHDIGSEMSSARVRAFNQSPSRTRRVPPFGSAQSGGPPRSANSAQQEEKASASLASVFQQATAILGILNTYLDQVLAHCLSHQVAVKDTVLKPLGQLLFAVRDRIVSLCCYDRHGKTNVSRSYEFDMNGPFAAESNRPLRMLYWTSLDFAFVQRGLALLQIVMRLEMGQKYRCGPGHGHDKPPANKGFRQWSAVRDVCDHIGICLALRNLTSHHFGMTMAAIQTDQERVASDMVMADAAGVDLRTTPAAAMHGGGGTDTTPLNTDQCSAVLSFLETGLELLKVAAAAFTSGMASSSSVQAFPVTELGRCVWWLVHPFDGLAYESMKVLDGMHMDRIVMLSGTTRARKATTDVTLPSWLTPASPLLQHHICTLTNTFYGSPGCLSLAHRHVAAHISYHYVAFLRLYTAGCSSLLPSASSLQKALLEQCRVHAEAMLCLAAAASSGGAPSRRECDEGVSLTERLYGPNGTASTMRHRGDCFAEGNMRDSKHPRKDSNSSVAVDQRGGSGEQTSTDQDVASQPPVIAAVASWFVSNGKSWDREKQKTAHKMCVTATLEKFEDLGVVNFLIREMGGEFERTDFMSRAKAATIVSSLSSSSSPSPSPSLFGPQKNTVQISATQETVGASAGNGIRLAGFTLKPLSLVKSDIDITPMIDGDAPMGQEDEDEADADEGGEEDSLNSSGWSGDLLDASDSITGDEFNTMAMMMARASANAASSNEDCGSIVKIGSMVSISSLSAGGEEIGSLPSPLPVPPPPLSNLNVPAASSSSSSSKVLSAVSPLSFSSPDSPPRFIPAQHIPQDPDASYHARRSCTHLYSDKILHELLVMLVLRLCVLPGGGSLHPRYCARITAFKERDIQGRESGRKVMKSVANVPLYLHAHLNHRLNAHLADGLRRRASDMSALGVGVDTLVRLLCEKLFAGDGTGPMSLRNEGSESATTKEVGRFTHPIKQAQIAAGQFGAIHACRGPPVASGAAGRGNQAVDFAVKVVPLPTTSSRRCALVDVFAEVMALRMLSGVRSAVAMNETHRKGATCAKIGSQDYAEVDSLSPVAVEMIEYGVTREGYCIVMKRCSESLRSWRAKISEAEVDANPRRHLRRALVLFRDIVAKVARLHAAGVTHYDLKCDNVLVVGHLGSSEEGAMPAGGSAPAAPLPLPRLRLADFGEAHVTPGCHAEWTRSNWDRGTECIKSPEMLTISVATDAGRPQHDRRKAVGTSSASDVWSLGCLLYELIVGDYLFQDEDWTRFYCRLTGRGQQLIPDRARAALLKFGVGGRRVLEFLQSSMLVRDPRRRPTAAQLLQRMEKAGLGMAAVWGEEGKEERGGGGGSTRGWFGRCGCIL